MQDRAKVYVVMHKEILLFVQCSYEAIEVYFIAIKDMDMTLDANQAYETAMKLAG